MKSYLFREVNGVWLSHGVALSDQFADCKMGDIVEGKTYTNSAGMEVPFMSSLERVKNLADNELINYNSESHFLSISKNSAGIFEVAYVEKTQDLLDQYYLPDKKKDRLQDLEVAYTDTKKIILQNGTTWVIEGTTYKALKDKLTLIFSDNADLTKVYTFFEGDISKPNYYVNVIGYIWRYILKDFYENVLGVGNNRKIYDFAKSGIINAQDLTTLNAITWSFTPSVVLDVSGKAAELEELSDTPQYVLDLIAAAKDEQGEIHLVQTM